MSDGAANFVSAITALAALTASGAALWGVQSWKHQKRWDDSREIGKRMLLQLQDYRNHISRVRSPLTRPSEYQDQLEKRDHPMDDIWFWKNYYSYDYRIRKLEDKGTVLRAVFDEGCAVWGDEVESWLDPLFALESELLFYIRIHLRSTNPEVSELDREATKILLEDLRDCSVETYRLGIGKDHYWEEFLSVFKHIRAQVRDRMR